MVECDVALEALVNGEAKNTVLHFEPGGSGRANVVNRAGNILAQDDWVLDEMQRRVLKDGVTGIHCPSMDPQ